MDDFTRCLRFVEDLEEESGEQVPFAFGRGFVNTELPVVWDLNFLRVEKSGASWQQLAEAAERIQGGAGLHHRRIVVPDEEWAVDPLNEARRSGWEVTPLVFMVRTRQGQRSSH